MEFRVLDLFCGAGGFSYGLDKHVNIKTVLGLDFDANAINTFNKNIKGALGIVGDITDDNTKTDIIKRAKELGVNMVVGGPPCQGFSLKGKQLGLDDPRNFLFLEFVRIVEELKPEVFIIENVRNILNALGGYFLEQIKKDNIDRYNTLVEAGIPKDKSIEIIHQKLLEIADAAFKDFINYTFNPEDERDLEEKIKVQNEVVKAYREIEKVKKQNLQDIQTEKALAMLSLNNYRDELKAIEDKRKAELKAKQDEQRRIDLQRRKAIAMEKAAKKRKIDRAKALLEKAERARRMKNQE